MRNNKPFTMIAPSAGFTPRVMARIAERERAQVQRRALIGSALLVIVASAILALVVLWLISWVSVFVTTPHVIGSVVNAFSSLAFWTGKLLTSLWTVATLIAQNIGAAQMLSLAVIVLAMTLIWVRVVTGPFQLFPTTTTVGGLK